MSGAGLLTDEQRLDCLRLIRSERIGPRTFRALVREFGSAGQAVAALPEVARRAGRGAIRITSRAEAERERDALARMGARMLVLGEPDYPIPLAGIDTAPPLIAVRGAVSVLNRPMVAIVGSRNASAAGGVFTERLAAELGAAGFVTVSGLARGIDARAHAASLSTGTVAILAGGHERIYPEQNRPLLESILDRGGAVVSEMPIGWEPRGRDFPRRNRIVSGLSYGVVVVEAARRSGSLITARFALEQGREVFAVPGSPLDPRAEGTNDLIRGGATLCTSAENVVAAIAPLVSRGPVSLDRACREARSAYDGDLGLAFWDELDMPPEGREDPHAGFAERGPEVATPLSDREHLLGLLSVSPVTVDDLVRLTGLPVRSVQATLLELELAGSIERRAGNAICLSTASALVAP